MGKIIDIFANAIFIKPRLNLTQWAEKFRILSHESSSNYGRFKAFSYQVEPMNEISNPKRRKIVLLWGSQVGKSETINNAIGYFIHQEPSTILFLLPNDTDAEDYSKRRLAPMFRDCNVLNDLINSNDANNTILIKNFKSGNLALVGSNSPSKLASKPIKILLVDEADRCEPTKEGEYELSDQRKFYIKCPECGFAQMMKFEFLAWDKDESDAPIFESARYQCCECGALLTEQQKNEAVKGGEWIAGNPRSDVAGFFLNALYSPFYTMEDVVKDWYRSKDNSP